MREKIDRIKFGTDGWRGLIAENFTFKNVEIVSQATADYLNSGKPESPSKKSVVIGYDTRFLSQKFASAAAKVLAGNGLNVILSKSFLPSPALSWSVVNRKASLGIMITASHNSCEYNGFKIKTEIGSSAENLVTGSIEKYLYQNKPKSGTDILSVNLIPSYLKKLKNFVDMELLKKCRIKIIYDPMFGAGMNLLPQILMSTGCRVSLIHCAADPCFGGLHPEPIEKYLGDLICEVKKVKADIGIATDGDADRIGAVDDKGRYLTPHQIFPLILSYLIEEKKLKGKVVQAISLGYLGERIAKFYGLPFEEVPVGFKYIAGLMAKENVLMGGEESGGFGHRGYIPERDGTLNALLLIEMLVKKGKKLSVILGELQRRFGASHYGRMDLKYEDFKNPQKNSQVKGQNFKKDMTEAIIKKLPMNIAGMKVRETKTYDGVKFILGEKDVIGGEAWLLLRASGTEPLVRIYAESNSPKKTKELLGTGKKMVYTRFFERINK